MNKPLTITMFHSIFKLSLILLLFSSIACSKDTTKEEVEIEANASGDQNDNNNAENDEESNSGDGNGNNGEQESPCSGTTSSIFSEENGLLTVEFEDAEFSGDWKLRSDGDSYSGEGYMVWEGSQSLGNPGNGIVTFELKIQNPGTYQFLWKSAVKTGNNGTEHNDSWLRFADAQDFYAKNGESIVYPEGTGKTPNPEGATKDGWFKIYRSGNDLDFKWQARTFDNNAHDIFVVFENAGTYTMEVSARSSGHGIDKFVLFKEMSQQDATADSNELSESTCD